MSIIIHMLKLLSVNIEGQKHLDKIRTLLQKENPDVVCLMECFPETIDTIAGGEYPYRIHVPTYLVDQDEQNILIPSATRRWGEVIISKYPLQQTSITYLSMDPYGPENLPTHGTDNHIPALILVNLEFEGKKYQIGTIHLTWTPKASMTARQRKNVSELLGLVKNKELILAGDFNVPRGNKMYMKIAQKLKDNVPPQVVTTLDPKLHYRNVGHPGSLKLVVDYVWSTPKYKVYDLRVRSGVSDHCALVCTISLV